MPTAEGFAYANVPLVVCPYRNVVYGAGTDLIMHRDRLGLDREEGFVGMAERHGLKWALLAQVAERDAYGYQLVQRCEELVGDAFELSPSAIYTSLRALAREGYLIERGSHASGTQRSPKVVYTKTERGTTAVDEWMATRWFDPVRSDLAMKLALVRPQNAAVVLELIDDAEIECLAFIRKQSERIARLGGDPWHLPLVRHGQEYGLDHLNARVEWLRRGRALLREQIDRYERGLLGPVRE